MINAGVIIPLVDGALTLKMFWKDRRCQSWQVNRGSANPKDNAHHRRQPGNPLPFPPQPISRGKLPLCASFLRW